MHKLYQWIKIAESLAELTEQGNRNILECQVRGKKVCVVLSNEKLFACAAKCPHAGGNLSQGFVDANENIVCPVHRYKFRLSNGYNSSGEGYYLKTYPVMENGEGVFIGLTKESSFL